MTREQACFKLAAAHYGTEAPGLLALGDKFPGTWHYTRDRHRAVVHHMPADMWEVVDTEESEEAIKALARQRRRFG
jgi:alcohol dehydrogenase YqhD (iron-dependent ADH family)